MTDLLPRTTLPGDCATHKGLWEFDPRQNILLWSDTQYQIYGYIPREVVLGNDFLLDKTTYEYDMNRVTKIIDRAMHNLDRYSFRRRIMRKNGTLGLAYTEALITRLPNGNIQKIAGTTVDVGDGERAIDFNNRAYFETLFNNYKAAILSQVKFYVKDTMLAQDLCQEVFIKAWINIPEYDPDKGELYTWLAGITRNHCLDFFRSKQYKSMTQTSLLDTDIALALRPVVPGLDKADIDMFLSQLNADQKMIIEMLFLKGYSQSEVSAMKNIPLGTVKSKCRTALRVLKQMRN